MKLPQSKQELTVFFDQESFVLKTVEQINKDLAGLALSSVDFSIDFELEVLPQLTLQLAAEIKKMTGRSIQQFIYKVDIKESEYLNTLSKEDDFQELALLVIRREAQKVYLKSKLS